MAEDQARASDELPDNLKKDVLQWCRDILTAQLDKKPNPTGPDLEGRRGGVFVTLKRSGQLRGCIGRFEFQTPLSDAIREMVLAAAFRDPRFPPLERRELADLDVTVSILTEPKPLASLDSLVIGRDGLYLLHPRGRGVLLPVVAVEQGWSAQQFARQTAVKAGLQPDAYQDPGAQLLVFAAPAFSTNPHEPL
jgi:AmmeMemoRadiSam system protein A